MLLYHGSDHVIEKPEFGAGKKHNDYGKGFYCTENQEPEEDQGRKYIGLRVCQIQIRFYIIRCNPHQVYKSHGEETQHHRN